MTQAAELSDPPPWTVGRKIKDPTKRSREAAILDQKVAGVMGNEAYAYIGVPKEKGWGVGIAVGERGYNEIQIDGGLHFDKRDEADYFAKCMNVHHIGLTQLRAIEIIASSLRRRFT